MDPAETVFYVPCSHGSSAVVSARGASGVKECAPAKYRGTSLIRNTQPPRITTGPRHRATVGSYGGGVLRSEIPL